MARIDVYMRWIILSILTVAAPAAADDTFESRAAGAQRISRLDDLVWAFTAPCTAGDDTQQRQCRRVRDARAAALANTTLLVEADRDAFAIGPWNAQTKSSPLTLTGCVRCRGVDVEGKRWYVVATPADGTGAQAAPRFDGATLRASTLLDNARTFPDAASAKRFAAAAAHAKVELLVKVPAKPAWTVGARTGVSLELLGYRVASPCTGEVVIANPASGRAPVDKVACSGAVAKMEVEQLTPLVIKQAMKPALDEAKNCYATYKVAGKARLRMTIAADGTVAEYEQQGDFANTPTGACIDGAVKAVAFPRSKKARTPIAIPLALP